MKPLAPAEGHRSSPKIVSGWPASWQADWLAGMFPGGRASWLVGGWVYVRVGEGLLASLLNARGRLACWLACLLAGWLAG